MHECNDNQQLLHFFDNDFIRYRCIIHQLAPPCPQWDQAMGDFYGNHEISQSRFFVDSVSEISLVAWVFGNHLRLEGSLDKVDSGNMANWCRKVSPQSIATTHEPIKSFFSNSFNVSQWKQIAEYTATGDSFHNRITHPVRKLSPDDRSMWRRFVDRHPTEPTIQARPGSQAAIRDFEFMCMGLPVDYYITQEKGEITGFLTVNPFTNRCDEIAVLFVDPAHRRKGLAYSLLSTATQDILERRHQPGYMAAGGTHDRPDLFHMLIKLGYHLVSTPWHGEI